MTLADFQTWKKQGCPFPIGAAVYDREGDQPALKRLFALGENEFSKEKLYKALEDLAGRSVPKQKPAKNEPKTVTKDRNTVDEVKSSLNLAKEIIKIDEQLIKCYKDQSNMHSKMKLQTHKAKRGALAVQILETGRQIRTLISRKKYIETNNAIPPEVKELTIEEIQDRADLKKKELANRVYISKYKNRADKADEVNRRTRENKEIAKILAE